MQNPFFSLSEARRFVALGLPVFVAQMSQMGMNFVDTAMTGQASTADMAAVAVAGSIWNPLSLLGIGCLLSLPAMSAHLVGGGQRLRTPHLLRQGIWLTLVISTGMLAVAERVSPLQGRSVADRRQRGPAVCPGTSFPAMARACHSGGEQV